MIFSCIIPASKKDAKSNMLKELVASIRSQDFPQDQIEILVITEGDSEQAKGIGIRRAKGEICAMFCADNKIMTHDLFATMKNLFDEQPEVSAAYSRTYHYDKKDNSLNRYFSLIGGNDPVCYYLGKNDRWPQVFSLRKTSSYQPSYGCNGFFYRAALIKATDLDHYYPMDNALDVPGTFMPLMSGSIWHRTSDNLFTFLRKRYRYARDLYCDRGDRRWRMLDTKEDYINLGIFIGCTVLTIPTLLLSARGFSKMRDPAWFWHPIVCWGFLITYTILTIRNLIRHGALFQKRPSLSPV